MQGYKTLNVLRKRLLDNHEGAITRDQYNIGDFVSADQFICKTPRCLPSRYGRESQDCGFQGGTILIDAASGLNWVENQVSLGANKTVMGKARFEHWLYDQCVCEVKHYWCGARLRGSKTLKKCKIKSFNLPYRPGFKHQLMFPDVTV